MSERIKESLGDKLKRIIKKAEKDRRKWTYAGPRRTWPKGSK